MITEKEYLEAKRIVETYESEQLNKHAVSGRSGQLFCPSCESSIIVSDKRHNVKMCGVCKHQWAK